jgi:Fe-S cluster assembly protein SufD
MLVNLGVEIVLKRGARLNHVRLQEEPASVLHVATVGASLGRDARYRAMLANLGARLSRVDVNVRLAEPGAEALLHSVTVLGEEAHGDVTTVMDHASPHTSSRQMFKSVLDGRARSVAQGRVTVRPGAVKSDSHQLFKSLLLSPRAEADAKPELEIFADDVICGHGTAIGALDANALFYLRSRGIAESEARTLLVRAFLEDAIEGFTEAAAHDALWQRIDPILAGMGEEP